MQIFMESKSIAMEKNYGSLKALSDRLIASNDPVR